MNHVNHEKLGVQRRSVVLLADGLMLFLGVYGSIFCLVTAFQLPVDGGKLTLTCLAAAAAALIVFSIPRLGVRLLLVLAALAALAGVVVWEYGQLRVGALVCARQVVATFGWSLGTSAELDISAWVGTLSFLREVQTSTLLCQVFAGAMGLWLGWLFVRVRSFWLTFWGSFPLLMVPLSVTITPAWTPLLLLVLFWGMGVLTRLPNKRDPYGAAKTTLCVLPLAAALLAGLMVLLPGEGYQRSDQIERLRLQLTDWVTMAGREMVSGDGNLGLGGGSTEVDLTKAGPLNYDGSTALRVEADTTGHIYLRGLSAAVYTGEGWEQLPDEAYEELKSGWMRQEMNLDAIISSQSQPDAARYVDVPVPGIGDYQPINFPALADRSTHPQVNAKRYIIENLAGSTAVVYTPYQLLTTPERMTGAEFIGDAYLARGTGVWKHVLYARDEANPLSGAVLTGADAEAEQNYRFFVREHYLQVPEDLQETLGSLLAESGIGGTARSWEELIHISEFDKGTIYYGSSLTVRVNIKAEERLELARQVAEFLAGFTEYDPDTPLTPAGEDFVSYFLTESCRGYCMHYASAAALMLRTLGVPARYVSGYVADTVAGERVDVPDYNAHAWVEVYCDGYGWQSVEVTPGFNGDFPWERDPDETAPPSPSASATPTPDPSPTPSAPQPTHSANQPGKAKADWSWLWWLTVPAALLLLAGALVLRRKLAARSRARRFADEDANRAVIEMYVYMERLLAFAPGRKADERAEELAKKAKFSQHILTGEEWEFVRAQTEKLARETDLSQKWYQRLVLRYLYGLY